MPPPPTAAAAARGGAAVDRRRVWPPSVALLPDRRQTGERYFIVPPMPAPPAALEGDLTDPAMRDTPAGTFLKFPRRWRLGLEAAIAVAGTAPTPLPATPPPTPFPTPELTPVPTMPDMYANRSAPTATKVPTQGPPWQPPPKTEAQRLVESVGCPSAGTIYPGCAQCLAPRKKEWWFWDDDYPMGQ